MGLTRLKYFERELIRASLAVKSIPDLVTFVLNGFKMAGEEVDYIEKNLSATSAPATGPISGLGALVPAAVSVKIAQGVVALVVGDNTITFDNPLSSDTYGVIPVVFDSSGRMSEFDPSRPTNRTRNGFKYNAAEAGTLYYFALVTG
jgi:hypothetical protein